MVCKFNFLNVSGAIDRVSGDLKNKNDSNAKNVPFFSKETDAKHSDRWCFGGLGMAEKTVSSQTEWWGASCANAQGMHPNHTIGSPSWGKGPYYHWVISLVWATYSETSMFSKLPLMQHLSLEYLEVGFLNVQICKTKPTTFELFNSLIQQW